MNDTHIFEHRAMKTVFALRLIETDTQRAADAANACFVRLDEIESHLSRYVVGSDIWRVNQLQAGEHCLLCEDAEACIRLAFEIHANTGGLFDITLGRQIEHRKNAGDGPVPGLEGQLMIDPERPAIYCAEPGREIDLGGIGKGYALDRMRELLAEWAIPSALLSAGASTQLACGNHSWRIHLQGESAVREIKLANEALSVSGTRIQGSHIISPDPNATGYSHQRVWLTNPLAAVADALSTASLLMELDDLKVLAAQGVAVYYETEDGIAACGE